VILGVLERIGSGLSQTTIGADCEGPFQLWVRIDEDGAITAEVSSVGRLKAVK
jgi:hypothetical protein